MTIESNAIISQTSPTAADERKSTKLNLTGKAFSEGLNEIESRGPPRTEFDSNLYDIAALVQPGNTAATETYDRGTNLFNAGRYQDAIAHCDEAIRHNPGYVDAYINRGNTRKDLGNLSGRRKTSTGRPKNPREDMTYYNRENAYNMLGQQHRAIQDYNRGDGCDKRESGVS